MRKIRCKPKLLWLSITILIIQLGCSHTPAIQPPPERLGKQGTIAIIPANFIPESNFHTFAKGRLSGAGKGAAGGAALGAGWGAMVAVESVFGVLLLPYFIAGGAVVGGLVGGTLGAYEAVPKADALDIETAINNALAELKIQETMAKHVLNSGMDLTHYNYDLFERQGPNSPNDKPKYTFLKKDNIDAVLEISVRDVGFEGGKGERPSISLFMTVHARLVRIVDEREIFSKVFEYKSTKLKLSDWADNDATMLRKAFDRSYKILSEKIIEDLFLLSDFHMESYWSTSQFCGLRPFYPECQSGFGAKGLKLRFFQVDSLQPILHWESFPRQRDKEADKTGLLSKISEATYDLKIWKLQDGFPMSLVYDRQCLTESGHKIELPLEKSTKYFWTVRARFEIDGQTRVTRWSYSRVPWIGGVVFLDPPDDPCKLNYIPNQNYFRFITSD